MDADGYRIGKQDMRLRTWSVSITGKPRNSWLKNRCEGTKSGERCGGFRITDREADEDPVD